MTTSPGKWTRWGVGGAVMTYGGLALLWMLAVPLFAPADETGHVTYGLALMDGRLPVAGLRADPAFADLGQQSTIMLIATHPPLYYAVSGPLEWLALRTGEEGLLLTLTRALNAALTVLSIVLVARLAGLVAPRDDPHRRAALIVGAAGLAATVPSLVVASGSIQNDALALALSTTVLVLLARAVRAGLTASDVVRLAAVCTLALLTRAALAPVVAAALAAVAVLTLWPGLRRRRPAASDWWRASGRIAVVAGAVTVGAGWFYALNLHRYGDLMGGSLLYRRVAARDWAEGADGGALGYLLRPGAVWTQLKQYGGLPARHLDEPTWSSTVLGALIGGALLVALLVTVHRFVRGRRDLDAQGRWMALGLVAVVTAAWLELGSHVAHKGTENNRYLLTGLAAWAVVAGLALTSVRWRAVPVLSVLVTTCGSVGSIAGTCAFVRPGTAGPHRWWEVLTEAMGSGGVPAPDVVLVLLLAAIAGGSALQVVALARIGRSPDQAPATPYNRSPASPRPGTM